MRAESIGLRTWWLATFAGWALLVCLLAVFGLGRRVELLPDDPQLAQRLPALPTPAAERLGPLSRYSEIAAHPVFAEDRQPHPFLLSGGDNAAATTALRLTGVLLTPRFQMATLTTEQGKSLRLRLGGDSVEGWRLLALQPRSATLEGAGGTQTLELQVFNGQGGQPPTVLGGARAPAAAVPGTAGSPPPAPAPPASPAPAAPGGQAPAPAQAPPPGATAAPKPSEDQMKAIRERIEARRRQLQQQRQNGASPAQNP